MSTTALITVADLFAFNDTGVYKNPPQSLVDIGLEIVNGWTSFVYWKTGRTPGYFTGLTNYSEVRDGTGSNVMFLLNGPISAVTSVQVNGITIPQSAGYGNAGWFIEANGNSLGIRGGGNSFVYGPFLWNQPTIFAKGKGNCLINYMGGYAETPADVYLASLKACTVILNLRQREDEGSHVIPTAGQTNYRSWPWPPSCIQMLNNYARTYMALGG